MEIDRPAAEAWINEQLKPIGSIETAHERPWSTVLRVPIDGGAAWFKACAPIQAFEPRLTADLSARWPEIATEVLAADDERSWLLLADAGTPIRQLGNPPQSWLSVLPRYAELQREEAQHIADHLAHGVPDRRVAMLPPLYEDLLRHDLPITIEEIARLWGFEARFADLCVQLAGHGPPETIQHDDLHGGNVYDRRGTLRLLDWGDACISHPFASLVVTFRFLALWNGLKPGDSWFARLRDAYLEPWGTGLVDVFEPAMRVGHVAHAFGWARQWDALPPEARPGFNTGFATVLRRALTRLAG